MKPMVVNTDYSLWELWIQGNEELYRIEEPSTYRRKRQDYLRHVLNQIKYIVKN